MSTCMHICICMCVRAYAHVYAYVCTRVSVYMHNYTVQLNSKLTLECMSLASTRKVCNITREIIASARTRLA